MPPSLAPVSHSCLQYFVDYKLADSNATSVHLRPYRESFLSYLGFFAMLPNLCLQVSNVLFKSSK